jgi:hypothetical protein
MTPWLIAGSAPVHPCRRWLLHAMLRDDPGDSWVGGYRATGTAGSGVGRWYDQQQVGMASSPWAANFLTNESSFESRVESLEVHPPTRLMVPPLLPRRLKVSVPNSSPIRIERAVQQSTTHHLACNATVFGQLS